MDYKHECTFHINILYLNFLEIVYNLYIFTIGKLIDNGATSIIIS